MNRQRGLVDSKGQHACLHPESHGNAKDGEEYNQWKEPTWRRGVFLVGGCEYK